MALSTFNPNLETGDPHKFGRNILKGISPGLGRAASFYGNELIPAGIGAQRGLLSMTTPGGVQAKVSSTRKSLLSDAARQAKLLRMRVEATGGGIGTQQAADVSTYNAANETANDLQAYYATPRGQQELYSIIADLQKQFPGMDVAATLTSIIQGTAKPEKQTDWGGLLSGIGAIGGLF